MTSGSRGLRTTIRVAVVAVVAVAVVGCDAITWGTAAPEASGVPGRSQAAQPATEPAVGRWPTCGQVRQTLTHKGYSFTHKTGIWQVIKGGALAITISDSDDATPGVSMSIYNAAYDKYLTDIDNVIVSIAPEAKSWAHDQLNQTKMVTSLDTSFGTSGGLISMSWDKSQAILVFNFGGAP